MVGSKRMQNQKADIEQLLNEGQTVQIKPRGASMYPMFIEGRDEAIIAPLSGCVVTDGKPASENGSPVPVGNAWLKKKHPVRGDVVLYRREHGILVLHRICRSTADGYYLVGDNQSEIEGPIRREQIRGILTGFIRKGKYISVRHPIYVISSRLWLILLPARPQIAGFLARVKRWVRR
ncbi:MAG: S24/S26 family peptidase [Clostridiales bacterium]|nr:S24/S26 family peptidase [Clostridiales bacterium]